MTALHQTPHSWRHSLFAAARIIAARLRFILLLGAVLVVVAAWPTLRNLWDTLTAPPGLNAGVSPGTEYWCPMCPGVASDWPGKCPVCHMALVVRQKGEMTPLPDGVVARMQFPPYRVQLAGIHTSPVEFRCLKREVVVAGLLEPATAKSEDLTRLTLTTDVFENDIGLLTVGQTFQMSSEAIPGQTFPARVAWLAPQTHLFARTSAVRLEIDNHRRELRPGMFLTARVPVTLAGLNSYRKLVLEAGTAATALDLCVASLASPPGAIQLGGLESLLDSAVRWATLQHGLLLAIPESAVIDTGARKVVFLERSPGLFDAVEVCLGRRCGDFYPVLGGLVAGQTVVTAGAFLLDAETRLNPAAAASYFGAGSRGGTLSATPTQRVTPAGLSAQDQLLVDRQKICPVTGESLGSMGVPVPVVVEGRTVFICCEGCAEPLKKNPGKYLAKLPK
jgi:hypothetical protein